MLELKVLGECKLRLAGFDYGQRTLSLVTLGQVSRQDALNQRRRGTLRSSLEPRTLRHLGNPERQRPDPRA